MKSQKTNAFQLAVAGGVLVLVLVCATFAWFATGSHASVGQILAEVFAPKVPSQFNSIQYRESSDIWSNYNGQILEIVPGKEWEFKVYFTAKKKDKLTMKLTQISAELREPESETETTTSSVQGGDTTEAPVTPYNPVPDISGFSGKLLVSVNGGKFRPLEITDYSAVILPYEYEDEKDDGIIDEDMPEGQTQYEYKYTIKLAEDAGNEYMDKVLSFVLEADLISSEGTSSESEG